MIKVNNDKVWCTGEGSELAVEAVLAVLAVRDTLVKDGNGKQITDKALVDTIKFALKNTKEIKDE